MSVAQPTRRGVLAVSAAAAASSFLPQHLAAAPDATNGVIAMTDAIRPFRINVPDEALVDLRRRIGATRWPEKETVADDSQGVPLATMQELARYWATDYDWRKCEAKLNSLPNFVTEIDGLDIHFIHVKSKHENALPMIVTHGWPGSVIEQLKIIDPLTNPTAHGASAADAFHLVIPSLPGYGFSAKPSTTGWDPDHIARAWFVLMKRLGYARFVAQGGDWGSPICNLMAKQGHPELLGHSRQPARYRSARHCQGPSGRRSAASRSLGRRGTRVQAAHRLIREEARLRPNHGDASANALRLGGFAHRSGRLAL